jgi:hypothetical protein
MPTPSAAPISPERLMQFTFGFAPPLIIETAIRHRVFAVLAEGAKSVAEVCAETSTSARGLRDGGGSNGSRVRLWKIELQN